VLPLFGRVKWVAVFVPVVKALEAREEGEDGFEVVGETGDFVVGAVEGGEVREGGGELGDGVEFGDFVFGQTQDSEFGVDGELVYLCVLELVGGEV